MKVKFKGFENYALVTGAASGMGRLYTQRLALMGYNIVAVDINAESLAQTRDIVEKLVGSSLPEYAGNFRFIDIVQDLSTMDAADRIWERTQAEGCVVEVLVNNAGLMFCNGIAETSERKLQMVMMVHMNTPLMLCRKYVNGMKERGCGYILNISSLAAWMDWPAIGMYGNTKRFL